MTADPGAAPLPPTPRRHDYAFPFRIDPSSRRSTLAAYPAHVDQMVRQVLLTSPGERVNLPQFGCGLRELVFAPANDALLTTLRMRIHAALEQWLGDQIRLHDVSVEGGGDPGTVEVTVAYTLIETLTRRSLTVTVA